MPDIPPFPSLTEMLLHARDTPASGLLVPNPLAGVLGKLETLLLRVGRVEDFVHFLKRELFGLIIS